MIDMLVIATAAAMSAEAPVLGQGPFAYHMDKTPEEGPVDPAVTGRYTRAWRQCSSGTANSAILANCLRAEFGREDLQLNLAWRKALRRVPPGRHQMLVDAQRRWIASRDPFCKSFVDGLRGSLSPIAYWDCRVEVTIRRTMWLEKL